MHMGRNLTYPRPKNTTKIEIWGLVRIHKVSTAPAKLAIILHVQFQKQNFYKHELEEPIGLE